MHVEAKSAILNCLATTAIYGEQQKQLVQTLSAGVV